MDKDKSVKILAGSILWIGFSWFMVSSKSIDVLYELSWGSDYLLFGSIFFIGGLIGKYTSHPIILFFFGQSICIWMNSKGITSKFNFLSIIIGLIMLLVFGIANIEILL